jgi:hypothetical protein
MATFDRLAKFVIVILCVVFFGSVSACACSMAAALEPPRASVHPKMFILVGEVIGYTEPVTDPNNFRETAVGLRMKIVEAIHVPYHRTDYVEVFMFRHDPDCFSVALEDKPTIGTRFRLALFPARLVSSYNGDGHVRLESRVFDRISVNESNFGFSTTTNSVFDYRTNIPVLIGSTSTTEMSDKRRWVDDFLYIESSKDLIRLARASDEGERMDVLERLLYSPYVDFRQLIFSKYGISAQPEISFVRGLLSPGAAAALTKKELETTKKKLRRLTAKERKLLEERARLEAGWKGGLWK